VDNKIVFTDKTTALLFARNFLNLQTDHWGGFEATSRYRIFADVLRLALKDGSIAEDDFWQDDNFLVTKLLASKNGEVQGILQILRHKSLSLLPKSNITVYKKFRHVDPLFVANDELVRLSQASHEFSQELENARQANKHGIVIASVAELASSK
jgi:hypothetical protein